MVHGDALGAKDGHRVAEGGGLLQILRRKGDVLAGRRLDDERFAPLPRRGVTLARRNVTPPGGRVVGWVPGHGDDGGKGPIADRHRRRPATLVCGYRRARAFFSNAMRSPTANSLPEARRSSSPSSPASRRRCLAISLRAATSARVTAMIAVVAVGVDAPPPVMSCSRAATASSAMAMRSWAA